jgi:glycosyltransferase involved in cell wall biosynthesis
LVPPFDTHALAAALRRLMSDPSLRERLRAGGQARVRQFGDLPTQLAALRRALNQAAA